MHVSPTVFVLQWADCQYVILKCSSILYHVNLEFTPKMPVEDSGYGDIDLRAYLSITCLHTRGCITPRSLPSTITFTVSNLSCKSSFRKDAVDRNALQQ